MSGNRELFFVLGVLSLCASGLGCGQGDLIPLNVQLGSRSVSKLPFVIAQDQGLYEKYGLDVDLRMPRPEFEGGRATRGLLTRMIDRIRKPNWTPHIIVDGATPHMVNMATNAGTPRQVFLAATDCVVRAHIIARKGIDSIEDLKGKRLGISSGTHTTTGYVALLLAARMGWDTVQDISIIRNAHNIQDLREGRVDAIVASERRYAEALQENYTVLLDTRTWGGIPIAGNSVKVEPAWLESDTNQEAARRFLQAMVEGVALFHENRALALAVLMKWHGMTDVMAETVYEGGRSIPRKPYPCYEGIERTIELYDSIEMRKHPPDYYYDDSLMRELDESGFIDSVYTAVSRR